MSPQTIRALPRKFPTGTPYINISQRIDASNAACVC